MARLWYFLASAVSASAWRASVWIIPRPSTYASTSPESFAASSPLAAAFRAVISFTTSVMASMPYGKMASSHEMTNEEKSKIFQKKTTSVLIFFVYLPTNTKYCKNIYQLAPYPSHNMEHY